MGVVSNIFMFPIAAASCIFEHAASFFRSLSVDAAVALDTRVVPLYGVSYGPIVKYGMPVPVPSPTVAPIVAPNSSLYSNGWLGMPSSWKDLWIAISPPMAGPSSPTPIPVDTPLPIQHGISIPGLFGMTHSLPHSLFSFTIAVASILLPLWVVCGWAFWGGIWHFKTIGKKK